MASSGFLYLQEFCESMVIPESVDILNKAIAFASTRRGIPVKINEFKLAERLEDLLDVALGQLEMERPNIKSA